MTTVVVNEATNLNGGLLANLLSRVQIAYCRRFIICELLFGNLQKINEDVQPISAAWRGVTMGMAIAMKNYFSKF